MLSSSWSSLVSVLKTGKRKRGLCRIVPLNSQFFPASDDDLNNLKIG